MKEEAPEEKDPLLGSYTRINQLTESEVEKILIDKNKLLEFLTNVCIEANDKLHRLSRESIDELELFLNIKTTSLEKEIGILE